MRWTGFTERGWPETALFRIENSDPPVIHLNSDVDLAVKVLDSRGTHGKAARVRDSLFTTIAHQGWTSILASLLTRSKAALDAGDLTASELLDNLADWEVSVLKAWAPLLHSGSGDPVEDLLDSLTAEHLSHVLTEAMPLAIQQQVDTPRFGLDSLIKDPAL